MHIKPSLAVALPIAISLVLVAAEIPANTWWTSAAFSLAAGVAALSLMACAALLGSRWGIVESSFGGLDRVYRAHKWMGIWALGLASFHLVFKAGLDDWQTAAIIELSRPLTRLVRQLSYVALVFIILLALNRNIPYSRWRLWHKTSGPLFLIVVAHWLSFDSPITLASPTGLWLSLVSILGVAGAAYKLLLYPFLAHHAEYEITGVSRGNHAMCLQLAPAGKPVRFKAGQFGFLRMKEEGLREPHPFTIASAANSTGQVEFLIRNLGDYTQQLINRCRPGMRADIYAPYGRFLRPPAGRREIWIGGGVGISPFVAWLKDETATGFERVTLFYFFSAGRAFPDVDVLADMARQRGVELVPVAGGAASPEFGDRFDAILRDAGSEVQVSFCGPKGLLTQVQSRLDAAGVPGANVHYEYFEFR